jgi:hypothetical protein
MLQFRANIRPEGTLPIGRFRSLASYRRWAGSRGTDIPIRTVKMPNIFLAYSAILFHN